MLFTDQRGVSIHLYKAIIKRNESNCTLDSHDGSNINPRFTVKMITLKGGFKSDLGLKMMGPKEPYDGPFRWKFIKD